MDLPDRIGPLIKQLEAGRPLTSEDVKRTAALQALDTLKMGQDFAREAAQRQREHIAGIRQRWEALCPQTP